MYLSWEIFYRFFTYQSASVAWLSSRGISFIPQSLADATLKQTNSLGYWWQKPHCLWVKKATCWYPRGHHGLLHGPANADFLPWIESVSPPISAEDNQTNLSVTVSYHILANLDQSPQQPDRGQKACTSWHVPSPSVIRVSWLSLGFDKFMISFLVALPDR